MKKAVRLFVWLALVLSSSTAMADNVVWYDGEHPVTYQVQGKVAPVVEQALQMFADDMELVTRHKAVPAKDAPIRIVQGKGSDDGFCIRVQNSQVVVEGHNARGTAYGILELSRMAGVSPWVWWGDVRPHSRFTPLSLPDTFRLEHTPSVQYRGIFINDEDWSIRRWSGDNMGPQTYKRLFQLLLRLRANAIWPAMHNVSPGFFTVPGNKEMADSFAILATCARSASSSFISSFSCSILAFAISCRCFSASSRSFFICLITFSLLSSFSFSAAFACSISSMRFFVSSSGSPPSDSCASFSASSSASIFFWRS